MASEGSFLERVRYGQPRDDLQREFDVTELARSVCRNLERVFNAWAGSAVIDPELGMPDDAFQGGSSSDISRRVIGHLVRNTKSYEPRLKDIRVRETDTDADDVGAWVFELEGRLATAPNRPRVRLTVRRDGRRYHVEF